MFFYWPFLLLVKICGGIESLLWDNVLKLAIFIVYLYWVFYWPFLLLVKIGGGIESLLCDNWPTLRVVAQQSRLFIDKDYMMLIMKMMLMMMLMWMNMLNMILI